MKTLLLIVSLLVINIGSEAIYSVAGGPMVWQRVILWLCGFLSCLALAEIRLPRLRKVKEEEFKI